MKARRTSKYISMVLPNKLILVVTVLLCTQSLPAQKVITANEYNDSAAVIHNVSVPVGNQSITTADSINANDTIATANDSLKPKKYVAINIENRELKWFQGFTMSADIFGPLLYLMSDYGTAEGSLRLNLKNTYFPVFEVGYGKCDKTDDNTSIRYKTNAPYFRVGIDFNVLKNKFQDNRLYVGARYGFSSFSYDMSGPDMTDPVWHGTAPFNYEGMKSTSHWAEIVLGVQVKIWSKFHMGWSIRYKKKIKMGQDIYAQPYYIPGYGTTVNESCWGGTYNLIFDLNWGKKVKDKS